MADGSVVIGVQLDTAAFSASAVRLEQQITSMGERLNGILASSLAQAGVENSMTGAFMSITRGVSVLADNLALSIRTAASAAIADFTGAGWTEAGRSASMSLTEGVRAGGSDMTGVVRGIADQARGVFSAEGWTGIGQSMMSGIAAGIRSAGEEVLSAVRALSAETEAAVKSHFDIRSPSRLMRDEVGVMISRGIAEGIQAGSSYVTGALSDSGGVMRDRGREAVPRGSITQNIYLRDSDTSPYQTARRIKRESEAALRQ